MCSLLLSIQTSSPTHLLKADAFQGGMRHPFLLSKGVLKELPKICFSLGFCEGSVAKGQAATPWKGALEPGIQSYKHGGKRCLRRSRQQISVGRIVAGILRRELSKEKDRGGENTLNF